MPRKQDATTRTCTCEKCILHVNKDGSRGIKRLPADHHSHLLSLSYERKQDDDRLAAEVVSFAFNDEDHCPLDSGSVLPESRHAPNEPRFEALLRAAHLVLCESAPAGPARRSSRQQNGGIGVPQERRSMVSYDTGVENNIPIDYDCNDHYEWPVNRENEVVQAVMFICIVCNVIFALSKTTTDVLLRLLKCVVESTIRQAGLSASHHPTLESIPKDSRTVREKYNLDGKAVICAVCPKCHALYRPSYERTDGMAIYPQKCVNTTKPGGCVCHETLTRRVVVGGNSAIIKPIKPFLYHSLFDYIASLTSQIHLENAIDEACDDLLKGRTLSRACRGPFEAEFLKNFPGPRPNTLFIDRGDEMRLAFSLNVDFFNVEGLRTKGSSTSCGVISMVCLNLPEDIRYKSENIYIAGIIPGPHEPRLADINPYLSPLITDMVILWRLGIRLSRTASAENGRVARAAIVLVVCDLPAARKVAGLYGISSDKFPCSICSCTSKDFGDVSTCFEKRNPKVLRREAERWFLAKSQAERVSVEKEYGVRWSELWRLPYWDPTKQLVVDSMHCLLLGLVENHFRFILSLTAEEATHASPSKPAYEYTFEKVPSVEENPTHYAHSQFSLNTVQTRHVARIHQVLLTPLYCDRNDSEWDMAWLKTELQKLQKKSLAFVICSLGLELSVFLNARNVLGRTKGDLVEQLVKWRFEKPLRSESEEAAYMKLTTPELISHIRNVIQNTSVPTWLAPVPKNFGAAAAGSMKADEWRTLCTIYLPLALTSYAAYVSEHRNAVVTNRIQLVLDHTMELVQAVTVLFKRSTNRERANAYDLHINQYIRQLKHVHPQANIVPNLHMSRHISEFLLFFGSVYSWWAFPFERLIGMLQRLPKNHKFAQMESTIHKSFMTGSRLKRWLAQPDCPPAIRACQIVYDEVYGISLQPTSDIMLIDDDDLSVAVPRTLGLIIDASKGVFRKRYTYRNVLYTVSEIHRGNSQIIFVPKGCVDPVPAVIQFINIANDVAFIVQRYQSRGRDVFDPFSRYPDFPAKVYSASFCELEVIEPNMILCHFASFQINPTHVVVLSLSRD